MMSDDPPIARADDVLGDRSGPDRRNPGLILEVRELRGATIALSSRVEALSNDFERVNNLRFQQQEVERQSATAVSEAAHALQIAQAAAPKGDVKDALRKASKTQVDAMNRLHRRSFKISAGFFLASLAVLAFTYYAANNALGKVRQQRIDECHTRVTVSAGAVIGYDQLLHNSMTITGDPVLRDFLIAARKAEAERTKVKCGG